MSAVNDASAHNTQESQGKKSATPRDEHMVVLLRDFISVKKLFPKKKVPVLDEQSRVLRRLRPRLFWIMGLCVFAMIVMGMAGLGTAVLVGLPMLFLGAVLFLLVIDLPKFDRIQLSVSGVLFFFYVLYSFQDILVFNLRRFGLAPIASIFKMSDEGMFLLLIGVMILYRAWRRQPVKVHPLLWFPAVMTAWSICCAIMNKTAFGIAALDNFLMVKGFCVFFVAQNLNFTNKTIIFMTNAYIKILFLVAAMEFMQIIYPDSGKTVLGLEPHYRDGVVRPTGPFEHAGVLGTYLGFTCNLLFGAFYSFKNRKYFWAYCLCFLCLLLSMTIRQLVGHALGVVIFLVLMNRPLVMKAVMIGLCLLPLAMPIIIKNVNNVKKNGDNFQGTNVRDQSYVVVEEILEKEPIWGYGPGSFGGFVSVTKDSPIYGRYNFDWINQEDSLVSTDTYWPHIKGEYGWPGYIFYCIWLAAQVALTWRAIGKNNPPMFRMLGIACFIGVFFGIFDSTFSVYYENTFVCLLMYTLWGLFVGYAHRLKLLNGKPDKPAIFIKTDPFLVKFVGEGPYDYKREDVLTEKEFFFWRRRAAQNPELRLHE